MVGAGAIAQAYAQAFGESQGAELVAIADTRHDAAVALAESRQAKSFDDYKQMIESCKLDAVIVCTPPVSHPSICQDFMRAGIHVLCEKPLAIDSVSARQMVHCADDNKVLFTMGSKFRYVKDVIRAKALIESGILGTPILFENSFTGFVNMQSRWNSNPEISGGGVLIDNGTHSVDIVRFLFGPLEDVQTVEGKRIQAIDVEDTARMFLRTESGVLCSVDLSWSFNKHQSTYIGIHCENGTIQLGWQEAKYRRSSDQDWTVFGDGYKKIDAFRDQIDNFADAICERDVLRIRSCDAVASVEVIEAAYRSLNGRNWVQVSAVAAEESHETSSV